MRKILNTICSAALLVMGAVATNAAPIPLSATGVGKTVSITGHPYNVLGGGGFSATIAGFETLVWCVDSQNEVTVGDMYVANVTLLDDWLLGMNDLVEKGETTAWSDGKSLTPLQRYQAAAYLVGQYSGFPDGPDANTAANRNIQRAIWRTTHESGGGGLFPGANSYYTNAMNFIQLPGNIDFGKGTWAVVSGPATLNGELLDKGTIQTFLVQVAATETPEPATYGLIGAALVGLACYRRRFV